MIQSTALQRLPGTPDPDKLWHTPDGQVIAGDCFGDSAKPPVFLLHGGGQTRHAWKGAGRILADAGYYAIALDARGHGDSSWQADGDYRFTDMVQDLVHVIEQEALVKPVLVGASMGGMVSMYAQGTGAVDAGALALVDIAPKTNRQGTRRIKDFMQQGREGFESLEQVASAIGAYQPQRATKRSLDGLAKNVRLGNDGRYYWHWDPALFVGQDFELNALDMRSSASSLDLPVLLVRGGMSDVLTDESVEDFRKLCPHMQYVNVSGAAHMVAGDRNDAFIEAILGFIQAET